MVKNTRGIGVFEDIYDFLAGNNQHRQFSPANVEDAEIDYDKKRIYLLYKGTPIFLALESFSCHDLTTGQLETLLEKRGVEYRGPVHDELVKQCEKSMRGGA